jgi:hypothetical protein
VAISSARYIFLNCYTYGQHFPGSKVLVAAAVDVEAVVAVDVEAVVEAYRNWMRKRDSYGYT